MPFDLQTHPGPPAWALPAACALLLAACGGGGGASDGSVPSPTPSDSARISAATLTANSNPACSASQVPEGFYWEIGDRNGARASGTVSGRNTPTAGQVIAIASASKWIYATYALQKVGGLRSSDIPYLNFTSGNVYPLLGAGAAKEATCGVGETVGECAAPAEQRFSASGRFYYSAGHFQVHAARLLGLADMGAAALTSEVAGVLGSSDFLYLQTNLAGGVNTSATAYAAFLRRLLAGSYVMASHLGEQKVCGSGACAAGLVLSPAPADEGWNYALGHWVEDDPIVGDHAFSSAGALGFYPWIDQSRTWYGVLARRAESTGGQQGVVSLNCGRLIRQAWIKGVAVTNTTTPTP